MIKYFKICIICISLIIPTICSGQIHNVLTNSPNISSFSKMNYNFEKNFTKIQIDSMIVADSLTNIDSWIILPMISENNKTKKFYQFIFIKSLNNKQIIYTVTKFNNSDTYKCNKKITTK